MKRKMEINGLTIEAEYPDKTVETIFLPLLSGLSRKQRELGRRLVVLLAAPPATGKSTLVKFLTQLSGETPGLVPVTAVGMDGFHHYQEYLLSHTVFRDGKEIPMTYVKGAPVSYDLDGFRARLSRVRTEKACPWPEYNRKLHDPVDNAVLIEGDLVLIEGNYLLLDQDGWRDLRDYADYTIRILAKEEDVRDRLIWRRASNGVPQKEAEYMVDSNDLPNVRLCMEESMEGDLTLRLDGSGDYEYVSGRLP
ncbi:MAG: nucleoside/nucleotide kinase family protein [Lachnospiraceae bacterium]|nr:nucleoside/nucleotide kinase family protein [Lachnospiraceae bacterium]